MSIFDNNHLILDADCKTQLDVFKFIAKKAKDLKIIKDEKNLVDGLVKREKVSTTGMKKSFAIPHAMNADIKAPAIIAVRLKKPIDWKSFDKKPVKFAIALLIPKKNLSDLHMEYLARISTALMDEKICEKLLMTKQAKTVCEIIEKAINKKNTNLSTVKSSSKSLNVKKTDSSIPLIIGVSACATGIAHTFMTREALEKAGKELNVNVHIETEGQNGREHALTSELIQKADYVIIASDINVDTDRFEGKKIFFCDTNAAINNPKKILNDTMNRSTVHGVAQTKNASSSKNDDPFNTNKTSGKFMKPFLSGISHMIPVIVFSGIVYAILNAVNMIAGGGDVEGSAMWYAMQAANVGFALFTAIMGAYIADAVGGRAAFGPGLIATFVAATPAMYWDWNGLIPKEVIINIEGAAEATIISNISLAIFAALIMGFSAGYLVKWINTWRVKPIFRSLISIIFIPVVATSILVFPFVFFLSGPLGCAMNYFAAGLALGGSITGVNFLMGFLLGAMIGFDMGGPVNKIAVATGTCLIPIDPRIMGACAAAIPVAPFGCGLATVLFRKVFSDDERKLGVAALALGFMGISEGAIPMFAKNPKQTVIANVIGSAFAGGLAFLFFVGGHVGMWGGPLIALFLGVYSDPGQLGIVIPSIFGGADINSALKYLSILWFFLAIAIGSLIQMVIYSTLIGMKNSKKSFGKTLAGIFKR